MTDLVQLFEKRILTTIRLTEHQKTVLAKILASPEGNLPDEDISRGPNLKQARDLLIQLDMITNDGENKYSVTDKGQKIAKDENIIDDTGELTEQGQGLAYPEESGDKPAPETSQGPGGPDDFPAPDAFAQTSTEIAEPPAFGPSESYQFSFIGELLGEEKEKWNVYDTHTKQNVGKPVSSRKAATRKVDRLDNAYGAYRYQAKRA